MTTTPTDHRTTRPRRPAPPPRERDPHRQHHRRAERRESAARVGRLAGEQLAVAAGQLGAGVGNLVFALVAARVLAPGAFAELAAFLALYLLIHVPAGSLSAGSALSPALARQVRRRAFLAGSAVGGALAVLALPLAALLDLSPLLLLAAAAAAPTAGLLALDRGRLYGLGRRRRVVTSLLAEPAVRLSIGVALAALTGAAGGAIAVVLAGWAALAVAHLPAREARAARAGNGRVAAGGGERTAQAGGAVAAFLLLAVVQNLDVLLANALLDPGEAGRFAVVSTLGGAAAFATTTVPLMLLPRAAEHGRDALRAALGVAALLGLGAVLVVAVSPGSLVSLVFGGRYESAGAIAVPYVLAMALLGVARVLVAHACAHGHASRTIALLAPVALLHLALVVVLGDDAAGIATATLIATTTLTAGAAAAALRPAPSLAALRALVIRRDVAIVAALATAGLILRLLATRGIWLDEATSIHQAQMPLGDMLDIMRATDVHPPLHHVVLWATVRVLGTGELAVRAPSLLAATALIPLLYVVGRTLYDRRAGHAAAALGTVAPFAVWYAQEARMYALFMVFALLAVYFQVRIVRDGARARDWVGYVLAAAALVYTQYFGLLFVGVQQLAFAFAASRDAIPKGKALAWTGALVLLVLPLAPFALDQFAANESAGRGFQQPSQAGGSVEPGATPGAYAALTNVAWAVLGYHSNTTMTALAALWPLGLLLALTLLGRGRSWPTLLVAACAIVPAVGLFALGQLKPFVFEVRYFIGIVPLALLLIARGLTSWAIKPAVAMLACAAGVAALGLGLADQQLNGSNPRVYDFKQAVHTIEQRAEPGDVIVYSPKYIDTVVGYYEEKGLRIRPLEDGLPRLRRGQRVFLLASFLDKAQYRETTKDAVRRLDRRYELVSRDTVPQIRTWEFSR
ncbi:MAG TPA: glycosyltransferase family 39 protein [Solirubrobacteraceae bacterium]|nr:glycosyltransferase family 39 protein [Solirubrobacteraceae bacterium]